MSVFVLTLHVQIRILYFPIMLAIFILSPPCACHISIYEESQSKNKWSESKLNSFIYNYKC
jgi:hypothetical protein